ncbi:MAG: hypothetical protein Q9182_006883 [Xanthomendoza sp. 2 TL-2023]
MSTQSAHPTPTRVLPKRKRKKPSKFCDDSDVSDFRGSDSNLDDENILLGKQKTKVAKTTKPISKKKIFPFTLLPPEIKLMIYADVLAHDHELYLTSWHWQPRRSVRLRHTRPFQKSFKRGRWRYYDHAAMRWTKKPSLQVQSVLLNKQTYAEAQPILYGANRFAFADMKALHIFCANIGPNNCALLKQMSIECWGRAHLGIDSFAKYAAFTTLASAVNLTCLDIGSAVSVGRGIWGDGKKVATEFYRDAHLWLEAFGKANGRLDAAVEIIGFGYVNTPFGEILTLERDDPRRRARKTRLAELKTGFQRELRELLYDA